jgi:hypothetical protein
MTAFAGENRNYPRRWAISAVLVLVVHAGIAAGLATWRVVTKQPEPFGPVVIELAPAPAVPASRQAVLPPPPEQVIPNPLPDKPIEKFEEKTEEKPAEKGGHKGEPIQVEEQPRMAAPGAPAAGGPSVKGGGVGGARPGAGSSGIESNPIDTRIAEPDPRARKAFKLKERKRPIIARSANPGARQQPHNPGGAPDIVRNAIGIHPNAPGVTTKTATGGAATNAVGSPLPNAVAGGPTRNAIGATALNNPGVVGANIGHQGTGLVTSAGTAAPPAGINGTRMIRPGSGANAIGGATKNSAGTINGTGVQSRQP